MRDDTLPTSAMVALSVCLIAVPLLIGAAIASAVYEMAPSACTHDRVATTSCDRPGETLVIEAGVALCRCEVTP